MEIKVKCSNCGIYLDFTIATEDDAVLVETSCDNCINTSYQDGFDNAEE